jgi:predicted O-methyltransferase YrrM
VVNFEDLIHLFSFNTHNRGIIRMDLDEASYLYTLVKGMDKPRICEIGTYFGGATCMMALAGGYIDTFDNYSSKTFDNYESSPILDVIELLKAYKVEDKCNVLKRDTHTYDTKRFKNYYDILLIDGDHSYEGVKADYNNWIETLKYDGNLLFHDSCIARKGATGRAEVMQFMKEIPYKKIIEVGSLTHFIKGK